MNRTAEVVSRTDPSSVEPRYLAMLEAQRDGWSSSENFDTWKNLYVSEYARVLRPGHSHAVRPGVQAAGYAGARHRVRRCRRDHRPRRGRYKGGRSGARPREPGTRGGAPKSTPLRSICAKGLHGRFPSRPPAWKLVILDNVLEHVENRQKILAALHRVLRFSGLLYMVTPKAFSVYSLWNDPDYNLAGLVLLHGPLQIWYFERMRGGGAGTYDVGVIATRWRLRRLLRAARFGWTVSLRKRRVSYLPERISRLAEVRPGAKRTLAAWLARRRWSFTNCKARALCDVAVGSNMFLSWGLP